MKKIKSILLTSLVAVTAFCGVACSNKTATKEVADFKVVGAVDEETGTRLNATEVEVAPKIVTRNGDKVSRVVAQVGADAEGFTPLRFVAAINTDVDMISGKIVVSEGQFGFHVAYNNGGGDRDIYYAVDKVKLSIAANVGDTTTVYASDNSTYQAKDGETKKSMSDFCAAANIEENNYNAFIAVEMEVPTDMIDTIIAVEAFSVDNDGVYDLSFQTKRANATGKASYFYSLGDATGELTYFHNEEFNYDEYRLSGVKAIANQTFKVFNSYGEEMNGTKNEAENIKNTWKDGRFVTPFAATYSIYYKPSQSRTYVSISDIDSSKIFFVKAKTDTFDWGTTENGVGIATYFFGGTGDKWQLMSKLNDNFYYCEIPSGQTKAIPCRVALNKALGWSNVFNQTDDIVLSGDNSVTITGWKDSPNNNSGYTDKKIRTSF